MEKHKMTVFENGDLRRMFAPKRQEVREDYRSRSNEKI
jgi:hypothetical protein